MFGAGVDPPTVHASLRIAVRDNLVDDTVSSIIFIKYYALAAAVLLYFDHLVTLPSEIQNIWGRQFTSATVLFLLNRYVPFFGFIPILISLFNPPWNLQVCLRFAPYIGALSATTNVIVAVILIIRTYALYARATWVLVLTGLVAAASLGVSVWSASSVKGALFTFQPIVICLPIFFGSNNELRIAWILSFSFDILIFLLTITRTYRFIKAHSSLQLRSGLAPLLMRDGSIYFLVMSVANAANYIFATMSSNSFFAQATGASSILSQVISVTMISRLMLNLRKEGTAHRSGRSRSSSSVPAGHGFHNDPAMTDTQLIFTTRIFGALTEELGSADPYAEYRTRRGTVSTVSGRSRTTGESSLAWTDDDAYLSGEVDEEEDKGGGAWGEEGESYELKNRSTSAGPSSIGTSSRTAAASTSSASASAFASGSRSDSRSGFGVTVNTASSSGLGTSSIGTQQSGASSSSRGKARSRGYAYARWDADSPDRETPLTPATTIVGSDPPLSAHPLLPSSPPGNSPSPSPLSGLSRPRHAYPPFPPALEPARRRSHSRSTSSGQVAEPHAYSGRVQHARHRSVDQAIYADMHGRDSDDEGLSSADVDDHDVRMGEFASASASGATASMAEAEALATSRERRPRSQSGHGHRKQENG